MNFRMLVQPRPMVPKKNVAVYGYGSVAWKDRVAKWKKRQNEKLMVGHYNQINDGEESDGNDLPM